MVCAKCALMILLHSTRIKYFLHLPPILYNQGNEFYWRTFLNGSDLEVQSYHALLDYPVAGLPRNNLRSRTHHQYQGHKHHHSHFLKSMYMVSDRFRVRCSHHKAFHYQSHSQYTTKDFQTPPDRVCCLRRNTPADQFQDTGQRSNRHQRLCHCHNYVLLLRRMLRRRCMCYCYLEYPQTRRRNSPYPVPLRAHRHFPMQRH